ncbi:hypothetical protein V1478_016949 [Vespula squamosa]|uniref:Uncharacterized protein n=1 Tax=Vespula squamosa TaxID=30214 RepID=A0ABD1ZY07_VESSQ
MISLLVKANSISRIFDFYNPIPYLWEQRSVACKKGVGPSGCSRHSSLDPDLIGPRVGCILLLSGCRRHSAVLRSRTVSYVRMREKKKKKEEEEEEEMVEVEVEVDRLYVLRCVEKRGGVRKREMDQLDVDR